MCLMIEIGVCFVFEINNTFRMSNCTYKCVKPRWVDVWTYEELKLKIVSHRINVMLKKMCSAICESTFNLSKIQVSKNIQFTTTYYVENEF